MGELFLVSVNYEPKILPRNPFSPVAFTGVLTGPLECGFLGPPDLFLECLEFSDLGLDD